MGRTIVLGLVLSLLALAGAASANAAEPLPFTMLAPEEGDTFDATSLGGVPFAIAGAPRLAPIYVVVARDPATGEGDIVDFFGLTASLAHAGSYTGISSVGGWVTRPGTYWWQARAAWSADGVAHAGIGPVRRVVISQRSEAMPILRRDESQNAARSHLRGEFASYRRGSDRRMRCDRVSRMHVRCTVRWRYRDLTYAGRVEVTASSDEELVAISRVHRRT